MIMMTISRIIQMKPIAGTISGLLLLISVEISAQSPNIDPSTLARVQGDLAVLRAEKVSRTPAQQKMASIYVTQLRKDRNEPQARALPSGSERFGVKFLRRGIVRVDVKGEITDRLIAQIESKGGTVVASAPAYGVMTADLPLTALEAIAELDEVRSIRPMAESIPQKGSVSEGDVAHSAPAARNFYGATGNGVSVGVISDSVDYLAQTQATGDLPAVTVLSDTSGSGEGTAMLEIVYDLAPDADLLFATGVNGGAAGMANAIQSLTQAGADIIVDDLFFLNQSPFQDDVIAQAAEDAISAGVAYFTSAGNYGNRNDITSSVFEGDYTSSGIPLNVPSVATTYPDFHLFAPGVFYNEVLSSGPAFLFWSDALGASANDYDLLLYDANFNFIASSTNIQNGNDDPFESILDVRAGELLVVARYTGAPRFIHLSVIGETEPALDYATGGFIRGQGGAERVITVAATSARNRTTAFNGSESVETFSSDGYRRVFYDRNGNPYTPGNYSSTGGQVRLKPNVTAADGVKTQSPEPGLNPFFGTSAAAPHAAAIGALMLSARPNLTLNQMIAGMVAGALDIEASGFDRDSGTGIIMADLVLDAITSVPNAPTLQSAVAGSGQVALTFTAPSDNGGIPISDYTGQCGSKSVQGGNSPLVVSGLTNGQTYACRVAASNAKGRGTYSNSINALFSISAPSAPQITKHRLWQRRNLPHR